MSGVNRPEIDIVPLPTILASGELIPQAVIAATAEEIGGETREIYSGEDDLDRYKGFGFLVDKTIPAAIMRYDGHPSGTVSLYVSYTLTDIQKISDLVAKVLTAFRISHDRLRWQRSDETKAKAEPERTTTPQRSRSHGKGKHLSELFHDTLKDIYFAEKKILTALPKMAKAAQSPELKAAFGKHESETEQQVARLEQIFKSIGETPKGKTCDAIMGMLDEGKEIMDEYKGMPALDAGLLAVAQAVEHYEISRYGTLKCWASELGYNDAVKLLDATLKEEKTADADLSEIAGMHVNHNSKHRNVA